MAAGDWNATSSAARPTTFISTISLGICWRRWARWRRGDWPADSLTATKRGCRTGPRNFPQEFAKRRGYDLRKYLPAMTGRVVESSEVSERFLWDIRRTCADLMGDYYYGRFAERCRQHKMKAYAEPYSGGPFEELQMRRAPRRADGRVLGGPGEQQLQREACRLHRAPVRETRGGRRILHRRPASSPCGRTTPTR